MTARVLLRQRTLLRTIILGLYRGLDQRLGRIHRAGQGGILEMPLVVDWSQAVIFLR